MKIYRRALTAILSLALVSAAFAGCASGGGASETEQSSASAATADEAAAPQGLAELGIDPRTVDVFPQILHDEAHVPGFQLEPPADGDTIAVVHTSEGDLTLRFFPDQAPKAVTNFITLAENGSYNGTTFHKVLPGKLIQGGHCGTDASAPNGVSAYGGAFEDEFCDSLCNLRGAVSLANTGKDSNGSRFFINCTTAEQFAADGGWSAYDEMWANTKAQLSNYKSSNLLPAYLEENGDRCINTAIIPAAVKKLYEDNGGNPSFDGAYNAADRGNTVFAQVIDGMDTVDKIAAVKTDDKDVPVKSIAVKSIEIKTYSGKAAAKK